MNRKEEIRNELAEISPFLAGLNLQSAFKVPKGYFAELPETILESVSPLAELKKAPGFSVPKNYFESLPDLVLDRVAPKQVTETVAETAKPATTPSSNWLDDIINSIAVLFQPRYAMRLAGVAVLLVAAFVFFHNTDNPNKGTIAGTEIDPFEEYGISIDDLSDEDVDVMLEDLFAEGISDEDLEGLL